MGINLATVYNVVRLVVKGRCKSVAIIYYLYYRMDRFPLLLGSLSSIFVEIFVKNGVYIPNYASAVFCLARVSYIVD